MTKKIIALSVAFLFAGLGVLLADTSADTHDVTISILEVALLGVDDDSTITLTTVAPGTAGDDVTGQTNSAKYLHYTCLNATSAERLIDAQLSAAAPAGTALLLTAVTSHIIPPFCRAVFWIPHYSDLPASTAQMSK